MNCNVMVLPSKEPGQIRLVKIPEDMESHEAFRHATGVIAAAEEANPEFTWDDIEDALEAKGFSSLDFVLGPELK
ncbi:hypothetical protein [Sedimenticola thiotaurini]|uniref:Uncharacterized protein n=1 Tax=Sedimenticola thiotaurini TaxID=1543721 RepID=A0A0F7K2S1_9GAMM|nr:hypothetical protein [Sedimenticola thiotaurini]AKH21223.1 hypothetical protein AAY24_13580 [Sedimenticola thiotaurini]